jgi:nitroimidazol reductase NimA-like FMN-containing flavoprotein (pyridoxamine 5'-phosphate oxidase superfamily)
MTRGDPLGSPVLCRYMAMMKGSQIVDEARPLAERKSDAFRRLREDKDMWVATSSSEGNPCMVPLSFFWNGEVLYFATITTNPTARNIAQNGVARVVLGHTRDVVLIDGKATPLSREQTPDEIADAYAAKCGWDPRTTKSYGFFEVRPVRVESWRELNEHGDRELMREGHWLE